MKTKITTVKGYLKALKEAIMEVDKFYADLSCYEKEVHYGSCRAYATFIAPIIYTDIERLEQERGILEDVKKRVQE